MRNAVKAVSKGTHGTGEKNEGVYHMDNVVYATDIDADDIKTY